MMWDSTIPAVANQHTGMRPYQFTLATKQPFAPSAGEGRNRLLSRGDMYEVSEYSNTGGQVFGVEPNYAQMRFVPLAEGRFIDAQDVADRRRVVVLGSKAAALLFPGRPVIGENIIINDISFAVVGRVDPISHGNNDSDNQKLYIPISIMQELFAYKGDNVARDALTGIAYHPTTKGTAPNPSPPSTGDRPAAQLRSSLKDAFDEFDTIQEEKLVSTILTQWISFSAASAS